MKILKLTDREMSCIHGGTTFNKGDDATQTLQIAPDGSCSVVCSCHAQSNTMAGYKKTMSINEEKWGK